LRERERERERERARNHFGSYASEQPQSHKIALHLLSEHVSAATMLFDFKGLGRRGVERSPSGASSCTCLGA
jgi:hypothetical protein